MKSVFKFLCFAVAVCTVFAASSAQASTITQSQTFSGIPNLMESATFNQFDSQLGTLESVQVSLNLNTTGGTLILDNDSDQTAAGIFEFGVIASISSSDVSLDNASSDPVIDNFGVFCSQSFSLAANQDDGINDFDSTSPDGLLYSGIAESGSASGFVNTSDFSDYTGTGTFDINLIVMQWQYYGNVSGIEWATNPVSTNGSIAVTYNYVPEPATLGLLSLGGLILRKRRKA